MHIPDLEKVHTSELLEKEVDSIIESPYSINDIDGDIFNQDGEIDLESVVLQIENINNNMQTLVNISMFSMIGIWVVIGAICGVIFSIYFKL